MKKLTKKQRHRAYKEMLLVMRKGTMCYQLKYVLSSLYSMKFSDSRSSPPLGEFLLFTPIGKEGKYTTWFNDVDFAGEDYFSDVVFNEQVTIIMFCIEMTK